MVAGLNLHQVTLNIVHLGGNGVSPKDALQAALTNATGQETLYQGARQGKRNAVAAKDATRAQVEEFCLKARDALKPFLGRSWNEGWAAAGFKNNTLTLPDALPDLIECLRALKEYFTNHSSQENFNAGVTANAASQALTNIKAAVQTVSDCKRDQRGKREERDAAVNGLLKLMGKLTSELEAALEPDDVRWLDFLDALPSDTRVPEPVSDMEVEGDGPGALDAEWPPTARAERYLVEIKIEGVDADFRRVATVREPNAQLGDLTPGSRGALRVVAANPAGESAPSPEVSFQVPAQADAA
jgi:hypothetical protein